MGNRATIVFTSRESISPAVYLHWQGGPESVYAFLSELDRRKARPDADYECARFIGIVAEFFDAEEYGTLSLGVVNGPAAITVEDLDKVMTDHGDNGFYVVDRVNNVVRRFVEEWPAPLDGSWVPARLKELDPLEVARERMEAETIEGMPGFAAIVRFYAENGKPVSQFG